MASRAFFSAPNNLFGNYRIRKLFDKWFVMIDGVDNEFDNFILARAYADRLEKQGYVDGDR